MTLTTCPDCSHQVTDQFLSCPHFGCIVKSIPKLSRIIKAVNRPSQNKNIWVDISLPQSVIGCYVSIALTNDRLSITFGEKH